MRSARAAYAARRLACLAIAVTLVGASASRTAAVETTLPEEALYQQLLRGEVDAARAGFGTLIDARLAALAAAPSASGPGADAADARRAGLVDTTVRAIRLWETGEVRLR